jgi:hypothetical protein
MKLRKQQRALIDKSEPAVEGSFHTSFDDVRNGIVMSDLVRALDRGDVDGAIRAMNIEEASFAPLRKSLTEVYDQGGNLAMAAMPKLEKKTING